MKVTKQSKQNSERDTHTGQVRLNKDIFAMMDTAVREPTAFLIISWRLPYLYSSIVTGPSHASAIGRPPDHMYTSRTFLVLTGEGALLIVDYKKVE